MVSVRLDTRVSFLLAAAAVFLATIVFLSGRSAPIVLLVLSTDGLATIAWVAGATALGATLLGLLKVDRATPLAVATAAAIGLGLFGLAALGLGLLGRLNRPVAFALPLLSIVAFTVELLIRHRDFQLDGERIKLWMLRPVGRNWLWLLPVFMLSLSAAGSTLLPGILWKPLDPHPYDVTSYHLQVPREWYELGRIVPLGHNMYSYFPFNVEMQYLLLMHAFAGPWAGMYACQILGLIYTALALLACINDADERGNNLGPVLLAAVPWVVMLAAVAYVESGLLLYTAVAVRWAMKAVKQNNKAGSWLTPLAVAGFAAGIAGGIKLTAVPMLVVAIPVAVAFAKPRQMPWPRLLQGLAMLALVATLALSPWLVRNLIWAHNPIWPVGMHALGADHFSADQVERFRLAHSPRPDQHAFSVLFTDVLTHWQYGYLLLPLGLLALIFRRDRQTIILLVTGLFTLVVWLGFSHLLARFLTPLLPITAIALGRIRLRPALSGVLSLACTATSACLVIPLLYAPLNPAAVVKNELPFAAVGLTDLTFMQPPELLPALRDPSLEIGLVGDAQAFFFQIPITRLHYKTVFDLPANDLDPFTAWLPPAAIGNPNYRLIINTDEIGRLNATYYKTPPLPSDWLDRRTFYLSGLAIPSAWPRASPSGLESPGR